MSEAAADPTRDSDLCPISRTSPWVPQLDRYPLQPRDRRAGLVLIADDSSVFRELYAIYLDHLGFSVHTVADGEAAFPGAVEAQKPLQ